MTLGLRITTEAFQDMDDIWEYIATESPARANRFIEGLFATAEMLRANPRLGRSRDEWLRGIRSIVHGRYVLFYEIRTECISIVRIIHGARDLRTALEE